MPNSGSRPIRHVASGKPPWLWRPWNRGVALPEIAKATTPTVARAQADEDVSEFMHLDLSAAHPSHLKKKVQKVTKMAGFEMSVERLGLAPMWRNSADL